MKFSDFLQKRDIEIYEVYYHKGALSFDQDDAEYIRQFDPKHQYQALMYRYNQAIPKALKKTARRVFLRADWVDIQDVKIKPKGAGKFIIYNNIKLNIPRLIKKLTDHGFDLLYWQKINKGTFHQNFKRWRAAAEATKEPTQSLKTLTPYKQKPKTNSFDPYERNQEIKKWGKIKDIASKIAFERISNFVDLMDDPENINYLNRWYWKRNFQDIVLSAVDYIKNNLKIIDHDEKLESKINSLITRFLVSYVQKGDVTRKVKNKLSDRVDPKLFPLLAKTWPKRDYETSGPAWTLGGDQGTQHSAFMNYISKLTNTEVDQNTGGIKAPRQQGWRTKKKPS